MDEKIDTHPVVIVCHRCTQRVTGSIGQKADGSHVTLGFYVMNDPQWVRFKQREDEHFVCAECMGADPRFQQELQRGNYSLGSA